MLKIYTSILFLATLMCFNRLVSAQSRCRNPNNNNGYCIDIRQCPTLRVLLSKKPLSNSDAQFLRESQCVNGYGNPPHVCCTEDTGFTNDNTDDDGDNDGPSDGSGIVTSPPSQSNGQGNVLPSPPICGIELADNKIYSGTETGINEFPWMALLEYRMSNGKKILNCAGSLINQRYVVTAAHCVTGRILDEVGPLERIRLGEYDISKEIDCVQVTDCADPIVEVGFEEVIPHENFNDRSVDRHNDIALIRLNRDIRYTYFIKPICLPSTLNLRTSEPGASVVVAGWGRTLLSRQSQVKQKLTIPIANKQDCAQKFSTRKINIADSQLCAGGRFAEDTCDGDSGGPLMKFENKSWALEGITSFGNRCGLEGWPAVYTRVASFENWIKRNMKP